MRMDAKLDKISELSNILCEKESLGQKIVAVSLLFGVAKLLSLTRARGQRRYTPYTGKSDE